MKTMTSQINENDFNSILINNPYISETLTPKDLSNLKEILINPFQIDFEEVANSTDVGYDVVSDDGIVYFTLVVGESLESQIDLEFFGHANSDDNTFIINLIYEEGVKCFSNPNDIEYKLEERDNYIYFAGLSMFF